MISSVDVGLRVVVWAFANSYGVKQQRSKSLEIGIVVAARDPLLQRHMYSLRLQRR
jgi:hypothetical protein